MFIQSIDIMIFIVFIFTGPSATPAGASLPDIKLKDLRYLVAVADLHHFGKAAERCFVSQPTLSTQLRKLEEYLGLQLIERQPNRVALTDAGEEIVSARAHRRGERRDGRAGAGTAIRSPGSCGSR